MTGTSLTLGAAGSRRTVYLVDENPKLAETNTVSTTTGDDELIDFNNENNNGNAANNNVNDAAPSTFLMFNRISNVIGSPSVGTTNGDDAVAQNAAAGTSTTNGTTDNKEKTDDTNAVWYEYGCV